MIDNTRWSLIGALAGSLVLAACSGSGGAAVDAAVDTLPRDTTPDTSPDFGSSPCANNVTVAKTFGNTMAVCDNTGFAPPDQCLAENLCNTGAGWKLCTASQYKDRVDSRGSDVQAWLKACIRDGEAAPTGPTDELCGTCKRVIGTNPYTMSWSCTGAPIHKSVRQRHIAVIADKLCHRVGTNDAANEAFWSTLASYSTRQAAVCCR